MQRLPLFAVTPSSYDAQVPRALAPVQFALDGRVLTARPPTGAQLRALAELHERIGEFAVYDHLAAMLDPADYAVVAAAPLPVIYELLAWLAAQWVPDDPVLCASLN